MELYIDFRGRPPEIGPLLERRGLVKTYLGEATPERGGRPKRRVKVEKAAVQQLVEARDEFLSMWRGLESLGDGVQG